MLNRLNLSILATIIGWAAIGTVMAAELPKPEGFPERPLTIIVPYGPGGGSDQVARAIAAPLEKIVGTGVQVINKPGGQGTAALPDFVSAPADGYTILQHTDEGVSMHAAGVISERPGTDWIPLGIFQVTFSQIYIRPDEKRFTDWKSLIDYAKSSEKKLTMANVGNVGSMERVTTLLLEQATGVAFEQISFDKPTERYSSLIGGHTDVLFEQPGDVRQYISGKRMKPILTLLKERPQAFADVPSLADIKVDVAPLYRWRGFFVRKEVSEERRQYLATAMGQAYKTPAFQEFNKANFMDVIESHYDTDGAKKLITEEITAYQKVYKKIGLVK